MSEETVEVVRRAFLSLDQGGAEDVAALTHEDFELIFMSSWPGERRVKGWTAAEAAMGQWIASFETFSGEAEKFIDVDEDHVVVVYCERGRPHGGTVEIEQRFGILYTVREGKIARMEWFDSLADALKAAGLSE